MMEQRRWIPAEQIAGLETQVDLLSQPLGTYLKSRNTVNSEQLTLLFNSQVIAATCKLFEIHHGQFKFDPQAPLAYGEMTGLSMTAKEIALLGLRMLKNWQGLANKLPIPESALQRLSSNPSVRLDTPEFQVWNLALGEMSIAQMAAKLSMTPEKVCQIGFRLSSIGLVQEVSAEPQQPQLDRSKSAPKPIAVGGGNAPAAISTSFLTNLMGFLKKKG